MSGKTAMTTHSPRSQSRTRRLSRKLLSIATLGATVAIAGCAGTNLPASVRGGECRVFERPQFVVLGKRRYDQDWIDGNVEAGVGACGWQRPKPRPASSDGGAAASAVAAPVKKRGLFGRAKARVKAIIHREPPSAAPRWPPSPVRTFDAIVTPPPAVASAPPPLPPKPPRSALDELLDPSK